MSGGVDSSLTALLLRESGHEVIGMTLRVLPDAPANTGAPDSISCSSSDNISDAARVAREHGFYHETIDVRDEFAREVIDPFCREYLAGRTPSPCLVCNARIKFRRIADRARELGCEKIATGHYARLKRSGEGRYYIARGAADAKDQSYFLSMLPQDLLALIEFPLGGYRKEDIRAMARERSLFVADKPESQEICFVCDDDYSSFIQRRTGMLPGPGDIVDTSGNIIGRHKGIHRYTIGQRRGLGIAAPEPLYVIAVDPAANTVIAGTRDHLYSRGFFADHLNHMKATRLEGRALVKIRSTQKAVPVTVEERDGGVRAFFDEPQAGVTPGQAAVFYDEEGGVLAGSWIAGGIQ